MDKKGQPLDYAFETEKSDKEVVQSFEEWIGQGYEGLNAFQKFTWHLQDHLWKTLFVVLVSSYLAGTHFGVFW